MADNATVELGPITDVTPEKLNGIDTSILKTIAKDKGGKLWEEALKQYPILESQDLAYKYSPQKNPKYMLEFMQGEDMPKWAEGKKAAVEVYNTKTTPLDILGDWASHQGVTTDPQLKALYEQFQGQLDPESMKNRYGYHTSKLGEKRPYEQWYQMTGLPEMFRGYTFNQWKDAKKMYTPEQLETLDKVRAYLNVK
jgi:hypothetical protein